MALTGTLSVRDGKRWITVSKFSDTTLQYPAKMLAPDKPLVMPDRPPLDLKINDKVSLRCVWVPPGKFFMGEPYYQCPHWQEAPPHLVTLTKGFYMAEHPITQEMFAAVVGGKAGAGKAAKAPINASCSDMYSFCRALSQTTGRKVRVPTAAEWEYTARVGTSNPTFREKYRDQDSSGVQPMAVKSKRPNAWGFYDMFSSGWERVSDSSAQLDRQEAVDPQHLPLEDQHPEDQHPEDQHPGGQHPGDQGRRHGHFGEGNAQYSIGEVEYIQSDAGPVKSYPGVIRFRVVVQPNER